MTRDVDARGGASDVNITTMTKGEGARDSTRAGLPGVPAGLGEAGAALWARITADYELRDDELVLLRTFCQVTDECEAMRLAIAAGGWVVEGSRKQQRPNPLINALAQSRALQVRLQGQLGLTDEDEDPARATPASRQAQRAAAARWSGHARQTRESRAQAPRT